MLSLLSLVSLRSLLSFPGTSSTHFRKLPLMKIRSQLVLAFLLLSVVPLTGIVLYSYASSQRAVRKVVEAEAEELTQEMNGRMSALCTELGRSAERVGEIHRVSLMDERPVEELEREFPEVLRAMGESAALVDSLQFTPAPDAEELERKVREAEMRNREVRGRLEQKRRQTRLLIGNDIEAPVKDQGRIVGWLRVQVKPEEILSRVLGRSRRERGEIPFAVDKEGKIHAVGGEDLEKVKALPIDWRRTDSSRQILDGWVVVTSKDRESGLTFGVARPIRQSLEELKSTAVRNFGYGLALIAFALVGILPLSNRMTRDVGVLKQGAERIAQGDLDTQVSVRSRNEIGALAAAFNRMAGDLRTNQEKLVEQETEQRLLRSEYERKTRELEEARTFQLSLLPTIRPAHPRFEIAVSMQTATEVGGDYYDFHLSDDGVLTTAVGDATGHGARAGTMVTVVKSLFSADSGRSAPRDFLAEAAGAVKRMELERMAMSLTLARMEGKTLTLAAAGMPPALLYRAATGEVEEIALEGMPLGGLAYDYQELSLEVASGDTLLLMSDGLPELQDEQGEPFGYPRVRQSFKELGGRAPENVIAGLGDTARAWTVGKPPGDDITFVVVRVRA